MIRPMTGRRSSDGFLAVLAMAAGCGSGRRRAAPRKGITGHDTPAEHSGLALPPPTAPACPPARRVRRGCAGNPRPGLPRVRSAIERAVREGTGKKRAPNGCTSVATATTAVHATSRNVTDIRLCIAALAAFPLRTVVPIGGSTGAGRGTELITQRDPTHRPVRLPAESTLSSRGRDCGGEPHDCRFCALANVAVQHPGRLRVGEADSDQGRLPAAPRVHLGGSEWARYWQLTIIELRGRLVGKGKIGDQ